MNKDIKNPSELKVGYISSILLAVLTIIGFGFAMTAIPPSGPYCPGNCMAYPFADILKYYPRDYYWMYITVFQLIIFLIFIIANHFNSSDNKKIYSFISVSLAIISTTALLADYFIQFSVVPVSMMKNETEGIALLTQYNGHGIFIALEELGFILMSLAFLFLSPVFSGKNRLEKSMRWIYTFPFIINLLSFIFYSIEYGINRSYRFEVATISVNWVTTIIIGILSGIYYKKEIKLNKNNT